MQTWSSTFSGLTNQAEHALITFLDKDLAKDSGCRKPGTLDLDQVQGEPPRPPQNHLALVERSLLNPVSENKRTYQTCAFVKTVSKGVA